MTRQEELVLLIVYLLKERSTLKYIRNNLIKQTGKEWSISSVYVPLDRLAETGLLDTFIGDPVSKRGGKAKKYYLINEKGINALQELRTMTNSLWQNVEEIVYEG